MSVTGTHITLLVQYLF